MASNWCGEIKHSAGEEQVFFLYFGGGGERVIFFERETLPSQGQRVVDRSKPRSASVHVSPHYQKTIRPVLTINIFI